MEERDRFFQQYVEIVRSRSLELETNLRDQIGSYFYLLSQENQKYNLTGYTELEDFVDFHLVDTMEILKRISFEENGRVADIGSGAGIPGILIKILQPTIFVSLVESSQKKAGFLKLVRKELKLGGVEVINHRAEDAAHQAQWRETYHWVIARALGSISMALEWSAGFVRPGGKIILPRGDEPDAWKEAQRCSALLGCHAERIENYSIPRRDKPFQVLFFTKDEFLCAKYPRKPGQILKRPL